MMLNKDYFLGACDQLNIMQLQKFISWRLQMCYLSKKIFVITLMTFSFQVSATEPLRIHDQGLDENDRIFTVNCPNGDRSSVTVTYTLEPTVEIAEVCIYPVNGRKTCQNGFWDVDEAAELSCK